MRRRAFTIVEAVIAMVVLAIAVPATLAMIHDATIIRAESAMSTRASWLGSMMAEQILADVASDDSRLGMTALEEPQTYLHHPDTGSSLAFAVPSRRTRHRASKRPWRSAPFGPNRSVPPATMIRISTDRSSSPCVGPRRAASPERLRSLSS